jgi:hypothetical protein
VLLHMRRRELNTMEHNYYTSKDISPDDNWGQLNIVDGGLALCKVCGELEGALPTDCPGEKNSHERGQEIYRGEIDFIAGKGWVEQPSKNSPAYWKKWREEQANEGD